MNAFGRRSGLWDEEDGFYLRSCCDCPDGDSVPMRVRSMVGLIPLFAVETIEPGVIDSVARVSQTDGMVSATIVPTLR